MPRALPDYYPITAPLEAAGDGADAPDQTSHQHWLEHFGRLVAARPWWVQLRVKSLSPEEHENLVLSCLEMASQNGVRLILNGPPELVRKLNLAGIHLTSRALMAASSRPLPAGFLVGASCHSAGELAQAVKIGVDFACLSPVMRGKTGGGEPVLGLDGFAGLVAGCAMPVYALGGLRREDIAAVKAARGQGIAGISAFWDRALQEQV